MFIVFLTQLFIWRSLIFFFFFLVVRRILLHKSIGLVLRKNMYKSWYLNIFPKNVFQAFVEQTDSILLL